MEVGRCFKSADVINVLCCLFAVRGLPEHIRSDNEPKCVAHSVRGGLSQAGVNTLSIANSSPWEHGCTESFNGKLRDELLNREVFLRLREARWVIACWRLDYNHERRHSALDCQTPAAFASNSVLQGSTTREPSEHSPTTEPEFFPSEWHNNRR